MAKCLVPLPASLATNRPTPEIARRPRTKGPDTPAPGGSPKAFGSPACPPDKACSESALVVRRGPPPEQACDGCEWWQQIGGTRQLPRQTCLLQLQWCRSFAACLRLEPLC